MGDKAAGIAYVFPGQGWQYPGVGKDLKNLEIAHDVFSRGTREIKGSGVLPSRSKFDLNLLCFEGTSRQLNIAENTQVATFAVSLAKYLEVKDSEGVTPNFVAGHSLGEYAAACAANTISLEDAFPLVYMRGKLMRKSDNGNGRMLSVLGMDESFISAAAKALDLYMAVINTHDNMVVSGRKNDIKDFDKSLGAFKRRGVRKNILKVPCAAHSPLMGEAQHNLRDYFTEITWRDADIPVVMSSGIITTSGSAIQKEMLNNLTETFHWERIVKTMLDNDAEHFVELWPDKKKRFLLGFIRKIRSALKKQAEEDSERMRLAFEYSRNW